MGFFGSEEYKVVVLVRTDIKMSKGKTAAQVAHAAVSCALQAVKKHQTVFSEWNSGGQKVVALKVGSKEELFGFKAAAEAQGIITGLVQDAGRTEVEPGTVTCMGIGPEKESVIDKLTGGLTMLRSHLFEEFDGTAPDVVYGGDYLELVLRHHLPEYGTLHQTLYACDGVQPLAYPRVPFSPERPADAVHEKTHMVAPSHALERGIHGTAMGVSHHDYQGDVEMLRCIFRRCQCRLSDGVARGAYGEYLPQSGVEHRLRDRTGVGTADYARERPLSVIRKVVAVTLAVGLQGLLAAISPVALDQASEGGFGLGVHS